jgi:DNA ligase D-like protein (predicted ligase)
MLATPRSEPFDSDDYIFEVKWDGTRVIAFCGDGLRLQNRRLLDITHRYPEIAPTLTRPAVLDGEIVVMYEGRPDFQRLQQRERARDDFHASILAEELPATYVVFDILHLGDRSLLGLPLQERRRILEDALETGGNVYLSEPVRREGIAFFEVARERGLEGIMAKRLDGPYQPGRRVDYWLKIKTYRSLDCVICGLTVGRGVRSDLFGALILGAYRGPDLVYVGKVGTGFDETLIREINRLAQPLVDRCPFPQEPKVEPAVKAWIRPSLVCEVKYLEFTADGKLRSPVFLRLRDDLAPEECSLPADVRGK